MSTTRRSAHRGRRLLSVVGIVGAVGLGVVALGAAPAGAQAFFPTASCPSGFGFDAFNGVCEAPATFFGCPAATTSVFGNVCVAPATFNGFDQFTGGAFAEGGNGGDASGGNGGRGGAGTLPVCDQNTNDAWWWDDGPLADCPAGGGGGNAGNGGVSLGGNGGLAFDF
jgi:hypothetical protein